MFQNSTLCLVLLRTGKLYSWCNKDQNVHRVMNELYSALFLKFIYLYMVESHDITTLNFVG